MGRSVGGECRGDGQQYRFHTGPGQKYVQTSNGVMYTTYLVYESVAPHPVCYDWSQWSKHSAPRRDSYSVKSLHLPSQNNPLRQDSEKWLRFRTHGALYARQLVWPESNCYTFCHKLQILRLKDSKTFTKSILWTPFCTSWAGISGSTSWYLLLAISCNFMPQVRILHSHWYGQTALLNACYLINLLELSNFPNLCLPLEGSRNSYLQVPKSQVSWCRKEQPT